MRQVGILFTAFLMACSVGQPSGAMDRQVVTSKQSEILFSGSGGSTPPITPPAAGLPAALTVYNTSGSPLTNAPVSYEQPFATADMPSGYHAVVYSGVTALTTQQDDCSAWAQDGSCKSTQLSFVAPSVAASSNTAYMVNAVVGAPSTTANISTAQAIANTNICVKSSDIAEADGTAEAAGTYSACLTWIVTNCTQFNSTTGYGTNPPCGWEYYSKGPVKIGIHAWQYLRRESDNAVHKWLRGDIWADMRGSGATPCPCSVSYQITEPNEFAPVGTVGNATMPGYVFSATLYNGANVLAYQGGASDSRTAVLANAKFNPTDDSLDMAGTWLANTGGIFPVKFTCATSCPTGITAGHIYWLGYRSGYHLYEHQCDMYQGYGGCAANVPIDFSSTGSGTITLTAYVFTNPYTGFLGLDVDANRFWISSAGTVTAAPTTLIGHDFPYLSQKTKAMPPIITALAGTLRTYPTAANYYPGTYMYPWSLNATGDAPGDERVAYNARTGVYALLNPADAQAAKSARVIAAGFARVEIYHYDPTSGQPMVLNYGPTKSGTSYPAMGGVYPSSRSWPYLTGSQITPYATTYDYDGLYWSYTARVDPSHLPMPMQTPLLKSGDPEWRVQAVNEANAVMAQTQFGSQTLGSTTYYRPFDRSEQTRGTAWATRVIAQANYFGRTSEPTTAYIKDMHADEAGWLVALLTNSAYYTSYAQTLGLMFSNIDAVTNFQPWQNQFVYLVTGMEEWRGEVADYATLNRYLEKFVLAAMDTGAGAGGCLWAGASREIYPFMNNTAFDWPNLAQNFTDLYTHQVAYQGLIGDKGWYPANGGPNPWACPSSGIITDPGSTSPDQPSGLLPFQAMTAAMGSVLGRPRTTTMYNAIRLVEYNAGMSFVTYTDTNGTQSIPEFAIGPLGATQ